MDKPAEAETIADGISLDWLDKRRIAVFTVKTTRRVSIDAWIEKTKEVINLWPSQEPCLIMHDSSAKGAGTTPYMQSRLKEFDQLPGLATRPTYIAIILPSTFVSTLITLWVRNHKTVPNFELSLFTSYAKGLEWLESKLIK